MTGDHMLTIAIHIFSGNIFNICIRFIWLNATYIIPNSCHTIFYCDRAIDPTLHYHKWSLIWHFVFL